MTNEILSYLEMCQRENASLQRGMNFRLGGDYSVILMSTRPNAPYVDTVKDEGRTLIYEGHDLPRSSDAPDPKLVDQPELTNGGNLTENGKFHRAAQNHKLRGKLPERVRVYEKIRQGIWSYNGLFHLDDSWVESDGTRNVFKFKLVTTQDDSASATAPAADIESGRVIPTAVKLEVWKRDGGRCAVCGATDELHFDHIIPYSRGGTSLKAENIQLLCARHNLSKSDKIE
jgi:hypothetical protein